MLIKASTILPGQSFFFGHRVSDNGVSWSSSQQNNTPEVSTIRNLGNAEGLFAVVERRLDKSVIAYADRAGIYPLYYLQTNEDMYLSTSLDELIRSSPSPLTVDKQAILEYLTFHYCLGDKTFVHEIRRVPQGIRLVYCTESKTLRFETNWDYTSLPYPEESNVEKQASALVEALEHAVRRRCQHSLKTVCLLSGGWDSRAVAGILSNSNIPFETLTTYGDTGLMDDPDCARLVAEEIGVPNSYIPIPPDYLEKYWKAKCQLTDFATTMHTWLMPMAQSHRFEGFVNLDGIAGDVAIKGLMLNEEQLDLRRAGKRNDLINVLLARHSMGNSNRCLNLNEYSSTWEEDLRESLQNELNKWGDHPNALSFFVLANRTRRAIAASPCLLLEKRLRNLAPFLDLEVLEAAMRIGPDRKITGEVYRRVLELISPRLARIPSSNDKVWPEGFNRRKKARLQCSTPATLTSYLEQIETAPDGFRRMIRSEWLNSAQKANKENVAARIRYLRDSQSLGEVSYWLKIYSLDLD